MITANGGRARVRASEGTSAAARMLRAAAYIAVGIPLGVAYLAVLLVALFSGALVAARANRARLRGPARTLWRCAALERHLANRLLGARIPPLPPLTRDAVTVVPAREGARRGAYRRAALLLAVKLIATAAAAAAICAGVALFVTLVVIGIEGIAGTDHGSVGPFTLDPALGALLLVVSAPVAVVVIAATPRIVSLLRALARATLATPLPAGGPVREMLAESLGDRTLSIAYWLPERETFVDERGLRVPLPEPGSDRAWTAVEYEGRRVAAIIHDANLDASPELVQAAAVGASLALDNERLKADLRARVEELRASRVRIVEAADAARRKLERDLHDGAQQQLVALAVDLRILRSRVGGNDDAVTMIGQIEDKLSAALADLRELARGIHPAILTDRGLEPAVQSLADRAPMPVLCEVELSDRPPAPVEAAAYFVVAEALTNVLKYAQASSATVRVRQPGDGSVVVVEIEDDGVGGADSSWGSGLRGLNDRVAALDGTLTVQSPTGGGTLVRAELPCQAATLVAEATAQG